MISFGFYDSINHDRRYSAFQFGSMFDGLIRDGIFMSIGTCFKVIPGEYMTIIVGAGKAWFNRTWTLNDAPLPLTLQQSEILLDRIDAIVLDINSEEDVRSNGIVIVKGTPSKNPQNPTLANTSYHHQYPLAYILVKSGVTSIRAADITNAVGTSATPYVTGILDTVNIDSLVDQWKDQWDEFYENQTSDMESTSAFWKDAWATWYDAQTSEIQTAYLSWKQGWDAWSDEYRTEMEDTADEWESLWNTWFYTYINQNQQEIVTWKQERDEAFEEWFNSLQTTLDSDVAANLTNRIIQLESCCEVVKEFMDGFLSNLTEDHTFYDRLSDNNDNEILDSSGHPINGKLVFIIKG